MVLDFVKSEIFVLGLECEGITESCELSLLVTVQVITHVLEFLLHLWPWPLCGSRTLQVCLTCRATNFCGPAECQLYL